MSEVVKRYTAKIKNSHDLYDTRQVVLAVDHDRVVSELTEAGVRMQAERDKWQQEAMRIAFAVCALGKMEFDQLTDDTKLIEVMSVIREAIQERDTLRAEAERLTALQLPPDHLPMPRRMLELLIGDPQNPYRANAESVASEMLSGALPDPESHEREFNAVRNVRLLLSEIDRLRAELNTRPGPGMRLCTACKAYHPAENFDPGMACCRAANERNPVYFVRLPDGSMEMHHKAQEASR